MRYLRKIFDAANRRLEEARNRYVKVIYDKVQADTTGEVINYYAEKARDGGLYSKTAGLKDIRQSILSRMCKYDIQRYHFLSTEEREDWYTKHGWNRSKALPVRRPAC